MTAAQAVPREAGRIRQDWLQLAAGTASPASFEPAMITGMPQPVQRWLAHAISPGTPLWGTVELSMRGQIRLGRWRSFTARQVLAPPVGYIWAATARVAGLPVTGYDRLSAGTGQMRWRLLHLIPAMTADGPDITRSACGRLASEAALLPTAFRLATWTQGDRADTAIATWRFGADTETAELRVAPGGELTEVRVQRWGSPDGTPFSRCPFGVAVEAESDFGGIIIPSQFRAGWWWGTDQQEAGEFFRARITRAQFR